MYSAPEIPQNQETIPTAPDTTQQEATRMAAVESANPPNPVHGTAQAGNGQNQQKVSGSPEITEEKATARSNQNQEQPSSVQEISPTARSNQEDLTTRGGTAPPVNETPKQDSTNVADQPPEGTPETHPTTKVNVTLKQDEASKPDSFSTDAITPQSPKKVSVCLPLLGIHKSKEKKQQSKKKKPIQATTATTPGKDEHSESTADLQKPAASQDITATASGQDEHTKSISDTAKPPVVQDSPTMSGKEQHSKSTTDPQKTTDAQGSATTSAKDELRKLIEADIKYIAEETNKLNKYKEEVIFQVNEAKQMFDDLCNNNQGTKTEFDDLRKVVTKLKLQIPLKHKADAEEKDPHKSRQASKSSRRVADAVKQQMPRLYKSSLFENCVEVKEFAALFNGFTVEKKLCLLCFVVFPEKAIIKKRLMVHWWIAEGLVQEDANRKTAEEFADEYFEDLTRLGFIEPVNMKRSLYVGCYKMHPFVRLALIMIAEKAKFFNFDEEGNPTEDSSGTLQACLMGKGLLDAQDLQNEHTSRDLEKLHAVFNVNEAILDFKPEWLSMMKNLNVLHLGSWKVSPTDHIEVEESNFLNGLGTMEHLKFFSLQGVSTIVELPESISNLSNLIILDLRACHSLESIPEGISCMQNLTYLDMSDCYLLEHMPKGISKLSNLRVLKGFVVREEQGKRQVKGKSTCTLKDLAKLEKLIKLSIYTGLGGFPTPEDLRDLQKIQALKKLTMAWGGTSLRTESNQTMKRREPQESIQLNKLEKLDLKSFPKTATPGWLVPSSLKSLKKLYIRGGKFSDLGQYQYLDQKGPNEPAKNKWNVEILRLKYLSEIKMDWRELQDLFPSLIYLEKVNCPKLSFFPSDGYGVWINQEKLKQMEVRSQ